jgi:asparagine synthase (glutamine-hydrolysing)
MCGIAGIFTGKPVDRQFLDRHAEQMANALRHRGPDDAGAWLESEAGLALAHRRLAVIDLSPGGHQPMVSASGRYAISFNGEIYNHLDLRRELEECSAAPNWRAHADTESLLAAIERWGVEPTLQRCLGLFAFALWDRRDRVLTLARDRMGEKPLYYGWVGQGEGRAFLFGSELKALRRFPGFEAVVSGEAVNQFLRFAHVPSPLSIYSGIYKLPPGCVLRLSQAAPASPPSRAPLPGETRDAFTIHRWWSLVEQVRTGAADPITDKAEALSELERVLGEAVSRQSFADVPLGALLSGGIDSSTIAALMQSRSSRPINSFTIGFEEKEFDEAPYARAVAQHLGTNHHEMQVTSAEAREVIPKLPEIYDEPFADRSQIPTYLLCRAAQRQVTVALSGDGADELFGGYNRYRWGTRLWSGLKLSPPAMRRAIATALEAIPDHPPETDASSRFFAGLPWPSGSAKARRKFAAWLRNSESLDTLYRCMRSQWNDADWLVLPESEREIPESIGGCSGLPIIPGADAPQLRMMLIDGLTYLPGQILCKVDRAAMTNSLETRAPFLDHRVVELAWRLPLRMKIRGDCGKWALRQILHKHAPAALFERPKAGFSIPLGRWLRGPVRDWAEALLPAANGDDAQFLRPGVIRQRWAEHLDGRCDHSSALWPILMLQSWRHSTGNLN